MSSLGWFILFFFILCFLVLLVYFLVVRAFYWGDPEATRGKREKKRKGEEERNKIKSGKV